MIRYDGKLLNMILKHLLNVMLNMTCIKLHQFKKTLKI